jgi:phosphoribosyl-ATP pyrophosphohydrolase
MKKMLYELFTILEQRKADPQPSSYTNRLLQMGEDEILKKVGEETMEVILAAKGQGNQRLLEETADLIYHLWVLLVARGLSLADVEAILAQRHQSAAQKPGS